MGALVARRVASRTEALDTPPRVLAFLFEQSEREIAARRADFLRDLSLGAGSVVSKEAGEALRSMCKALDAFAAGTPAPAAGYTEEAPQRIEL